MFADKHSPESAGRATRRSRRRKDAPPSGGAAPGKADAQATPPGARAPRCRFCGARMDRIVVDLGVSPLANSYLEPEDLARGEPFYPLRVYLCEACFLVQLEEFEQPERIFTDYAYFTSYSDLLVHQAERFAASAIERFGLGRDDLVIEVGSNDGYLLRNFVRSGVPVLGIDPAANVVRAAEERGVPTIARFFGEPLARELAEQGRYGALVVGNNVLAHVSDLNGFVRGFKLVLDRGGVATLEFPHLLRLMDEVQYDTIYHEHFSYFSFLTVERVFAAHELTIFDVDEIPAHGGSLRIYARHSDDETRPISSRVRDLKRRERAFGMDRIETYAGFHERVQRNKRELLRFLIDARDAGATVAGYGAPAKANTLLNYCGVRTDLLQYTVDRSPHKQGRYLPGTRIPIHAPARLMETRPDYVLILAWNLKEEIMQQAAYVRDWGGRFAVAVPRLEIL